MSKRAFRAPLNSGVGSYANGAPDDHASLPVHCTSGDLFLLIDAASREPIGSARCEIGLHCAENLRQNDEPVELRKAGDLAIAMLKLNMIEVKTASEAVDSPSMARVETRVACMTADQIIDLAHRTSDVKADVLRR